MTISAKVILCSQLDAPGAPPIWTLQLRYPRLIHAEFMTHRAFSRNASSSRAIPVKRMLEDIRKDPAMVTHWGRNEKGMQANVELDEADIAKARFIWREAAEAACQHAERLMELGLHKQVANRILEPYSHINVIVTATEWDNFFALRDHADAQPEIRQLAKKMRAAMTDVYWEGKIQTLFEGDWHLPYIRPAEEILSIQIKQKISAARCARVSYMTHDGRASEVDEDIELYDRLIEQKPAHASPIEHQAEAMHPISEPWKVGDKMKWGPYANFVGWRSLRASMEARGEM